MSLKVIGVGDNVVDKYMHTKVMYPGGNALNFSVYAKFLGADASYMGVFGTDDAAAHVQNIVGSLRIKMDRCRIVDGENGYACITLKDGDRSFLYSNKGGVARTNPLVFDNTDLKYLNEFDLICTSINSHIENELLKLKPLNPKVAYDFSIRDNDEIFNAVCPNIDFAIISCSDTPIEKIEEKCRKIHNLKCPYVIASRGKEGSLFSDGSNFYQHKADLVDAIDTLGAGDSFLTAFLLSFVEWKQQTANTNPTQNETEIAVMKAMDAGSRFSAKTCMTNGAFGYGKSFD